MQAGDQKRRQYRGGRKQGLKSETVKVREIKDVRGHSERHTQKMLYFPK